ncbi:MAG: formyltetrahydrofolate deformylase [Steroidobacteraceae bacterium]
MGEYVLSLSCRDRPGLVAAVATSILRLRGNITEAQQFNDPDSGRFFMRVMFAAEPVESSVRSAIGEVMQQHEMNWRLNDARHRKRVLLMVSKLDHCLVDLLYRHRIGELAMDVVAIASNHPRNPGSLVNPASVPFHHLPVDKDTRPQQEAQVRALIEESAAELVVLARYMQVFSDDMARWLAGRCINIHHSFLPGFKGARPYHQAHARGVKMIGATAHYVNTDLDEGPIIHQDVEPISHADRPDDLIRKGRDIERRVLAEAVRLHLEDRALLNGNKTVVFRG